jgi:signal transduction histidine kinase
LLLTYVLVTGLVLALVSLSLFFFLIRNPVSERTVYQSLQVEAVSLAPRLERALTAGRTEALQVALDRLDQRLRTRALVVQRDGSVVIDSRPEAALPPNEVLVQVGQSEGASQGQYRDSSGVRWLYVIQPLAGGGVLVLAAPRATLRALLGAGVDLAVPLLETAGVALVASLALAWLVSRWVAGPLQRVSRAARAVASGDYSHHVPPGGPVEVQETARAFNEMVRRVEAGQQAQRDFVANVSHELKTPLTSIQGFAQAILDGAASDVPAQQHAAQVIYDEAERLRRLVGNLLDLARLDAGQMTFERHPVDVAMLLRAVTERLSLRAAEKGVHVEVMTTVLPSIVGDGDRLAQVFTNLLDNALKHTPSGGRVTVQGESSAGWVTIHVDDSGPGIPPEELSRIFERFYQVDKARPGGEGRGAGLGLAISREIVQAHGGKLVAQSVPERGSRFSVQLPLTRPDDTTQARRRV